MAFPELGWDQPDGCLDQGHGGDFTPGQHEISDGDFLDRTRLDHPLVQPLEAGTVREILVQDGDRVTAGVPLIRLDSAITLADRDRVARDLQFARLDVARLTALSKEKEPERVLQAFLAPEDAGPHELETARDAAVSQASE